jgi:hypothetical protein
MTTPSQPAGAGDDIETLLDEADALRAHGVSTKETAALNAEDAK